MFPFSYKVDAVTHVKKFDQTITVPSGTFVGGIDLSDGALEGSISLPPAQFTFTLLGVGLVTATAKLVPTPGRLQPHTEFAAHGHCRVQHPHHRSNATQLNLVGSLCTTKTPVSVTMSANGNLGEPTTMSGIFTMPPFQYCGGPVVTNGLNLAISGPGNTFSATATPT